MSRTILSGNLTASSTGELKNLLEVTALFCKMEIHPFVKAFCSWLITFIDANKHLFSF